MSNSTDTDLSEVCNMVSKTQFICGGCEQTFDLSYPTAQICFGPGNDVLCCGRSEEALGTEDCTGDENIN